jgi:hypothetical protein
VGQQAKAAQVAKKSHLHRTKKSDRIVCPPKAKPSAVTWSKAGAMLFWLDTNWSKSLVPHRQFIERNKLKRVSPQPRRNYVLMLNAAGGGNTPRINEAYYRGQPCGALAHNFFVEPVKARDFRRTENQKKTIRSPKVKPPSIARSNAGVTLFVLTSAEAEI